MQEFVFFVSRPIRTRTDTWKVTVGSVRLKVHGPFDTSAEAWRFRRDLEERWRARAVALGGSMREGDAETWIVAVPDGTPVLGLRWFPEDPSEPTRKRRDPRDDPPLPLRLGPWKIV